MNVLLSVVSGSGSDLGQGGIIALLSILLVFLMLALIVLITWLVFIAIGKFTGKAKPPVVPVTAAPAPAPAELTEDAIAAALVASIDYRNETKKDIKVISIKEIN
ncbi:MAG: OadG family protein [Clostridia bacterium]|nr:OadG family protein [Clostridia bacterium]